MTIIDDYSDLCEEVRQRYTAIRTAFGCFSQGRDGPAWINVLDFIATFARTRSHVLELRKCLRRHLVFQDHTDILRNAAFVERLKRLAVDVPPGSARSGVLPLDDASVRRMVIGVRDTYSGRRDKAIVLLSYFGALTGYVLRHLDLADVSWCYRNARGHVGIEFIGRERGGRRRSVRITRHHDAAFCPVFALEQYVAARGQSPGPLFVARCGVTSRMNLSTFKDAVKRTMRLSGLDPAGHGTTSLKHGLIVTCVRRRIGGVAIMEKTGIRSAKTLAEWGNRADAGLLDASIL